MKLNHLPTRDVVLAIILGSSLIATHAVDTAFAPSSRHDLYIEPDHHIINTDSGGNPKATTAPAIGHNDRLEAGHYHHHDHQHSHDHTGDVFELCLVLCYQQLAEKYGVAVADELKADGFVFAENCGEEDDEGRKLGATSTLSWNIPSLRLPNGKLQIPYTVGTDHGDFTDDIGSTIQLAIDTIEAASSVLSFELRTTQNNWIHFQLVPSGCYANIGRSSPTYVDLGSCRTTDKLGLIIHEILHALGFWHEHSRPDRDDYVIINEDNIDQASLFNFKKRLYTEIDSLGSPYDYGSLMHYSSKLFTSNGEDTMVPTRALESWEVMGQPVRLSPQDIRQLRLLYQCNSSSRNLEGLTMENLCSVDCKCWEFALGTCDSDDECLGDLVCGTTPETLPVPEYVDQLPNDPPSGVQFSCRDYCSDGCCDSVYNAPKLLCPETCNSAPPYVAPTASEIPPRMCLMDLPTNNPSEAPADIQCYEAGKSVITRTKNGIEKSTTCKNLAKKTNWVKNSWCASTAVGDACPVTCDRCEGGCNEIDSNKFYLKTKNGEVLLKSCKFLKRRKANWSSSKLNKICNKSAPADHSNGAAACPITCETCF